MRAMQGEMEGRDMRQWPREHRLVAHACGVRATMRRVVPLLGASLLLAACESGLDKRIAAGMFTGVAIGSMVGPIAIAVGGGVGAIAGAVTPEDAARLEPEAPSGAAGNGPTLVGS
jgi:hypothetical protein